MNDARGERDRDPVETNDFARHAEAKPPGLLADLFGLIRQDKKWWLVPIVVCLLVIGLFVVLAGTVLGPFIYTFF